MTRPPRPEEEEGAALVVPRFEEGALLLRDEAGKAWRLSWEAREGEPAPADRRRALPAGTYEVFGYRLVRRAEDGTSWHVSVTGADIRRLVLEAGREHEVAVDPTIGVRVHRQGDRLHVQILGEKKAGLTLYRAGRRVPARWRTLDGDGKDLAHGTLTYG